MPKRIVVIEDDSKVRQLLEWSFRAPEFDFRGFADGRDALTKLHELEPDVIISDVMMPDMDGLVFLRVVKRSPELKDVPFIFLSAVRSEQEVQAALEAGADAFLVKPFPIKDLVEKVRALLARRGPDDPGSGVPAPSLREDKVMDSEKGTPGSRTSPGGPEDSAATLAHKSLGIAGRFSMLEVDGKNVQILTEVASRPNFTVTTVVARGGEGIRKIETSWRHPLQRNEDRELAKSQLEMQHERAMSMVSDLTVDSPSRGVLWSQQWRTVDGSLLAWSVNAAIEEARERIGFARAMNLLKQTHAELLRSRELLGLFRITTDGRVVAAAAGGAQMPQNAVDAVAVWMLAFFTRTVDLSDDGGRAHVRQTLGRRKDELERIGFFRAFDAAATRLPRPVAPHLSNAQ